MSGQRLHALAQNLEQAPRPRAVFDRGFPCKALFNNPPVVFVDHRCRFRVCFLSMGAHRRPRLGKPSLFEQRNRGMCSDRWVVAGEWWREEQGSDGERSMGVMEKERSMGEKPK